MINTVRLRLMIGWLGILLPWMVLGLSLGYGYEPPDSISHTYYIPTCIAPFMIILGAAALLLMSYKGYDWYDDILCSLTGICGLGICLFPCYDSNSENLVGTFLLEKSLSGTLHNIFAILFFVLLAYNSLFMFTKSNGTMTKKKKQRNVIYRVCGLGMVVSLIGLVFVTVFKIYGGTWVAEALALFFFGISWLTKANYYKILFAD